MLLRPVRIPILRGPLKGYWWSVFTGLDHLRGTYEPSKTRTVRKAVEEEDIVYDVGAHVGYYTLIASIRTGAEGRVFAFEPRPINLHFLEGHLRVNEANNVSIVAAAVGARSGSAQFDTSHGTGTGRLAEDGTLEVEIVSLDEVHDAGGLPPPDFMKVDVEGGEFAVLQGAERLIEESRPRILIASHGRDLTRRVVEWLEARGFRCSSIPADASGDTEILAHPDPAVHEQM